jgi:2-polyprenyl-6-methoxyphenol hydroxylase-like FAD-dependent oxidoreductase
MLPYMAQGAAMAIEDAMLLSRALSAARGDPDTGLARYEAARLPRANLVAQLSAAMGEMFTGDADAYARDADRSGGQTPGLLEYDPVTALV